jgi:hypothetical protein
MRAIPGDARKDKPRSQNGNDASMAVDIFCARCDHRGSARLANIVGLLFSVDGAEGAAA